MTLAAETKPQIGQFLPNNFQIAAVWLALALAANASANAPDTLRLTAPPRMLNNKTLTIKAELIDDAGQIDWRVWNSLGTVSATRVDDGTPVPLTVTVFERHTAGAGAGGPPTTSSIRFYNGVGCASFTLNNGAAVPAGDILVTVNVGAASASTSVAVLDAATPGLIQDLSGTLSGGNLIWEPADGVIHLTANVTVPAGQTLTILPGALIMVDPGPDGAGTRINSVNSNISALGTGAAPIYLFPTTGAAAMKLPQNGSEGSNNGHNNPSSWGGFELAGTGSMIWSYVFMTGAGNGVVSGHPRPTVIRLGDSHAFTATDSLVADSPGKILYGAGNGAYLFQRCLFARVGIGGEFIGAGYTLTMEDTWMTRVGRAPINTSNRLDGDILHIDQISTSRLRRCILTDGGDDVIDHSSGATPVIENSIIYDANDKVLSISGGTGSVTMTNCLVFNVPGGLYCTGAPAYLTNVTLGTNTNIFGAGCGSIIQQCVLWPGTVSSCCGVVNYTSVGNTGDVACGIGNLAVNPLFIDPNFSPPSDVSVNFGLQPSSPDRTAGPAGTQIGWLGFPAPALCQIAADCDDSDPCTSNECDGLRCVFKPAPCPPGILGDMNCDGLVNAADVSIFALALVDPIAYASAHPSCNIRRGDTNFDFRVDGADVPAFTDLVLP